MSPQPYIRNILCPVLAIFGERDNIVDFRESASFYLSELPHNGNPDITVRIFPNADHVIFYSEKGSSEEINNAFSAPVKHFADGYLATMTEWLTLHLV